MDEDENIKSEGECIEFLKFIFAEAPAFYYQIAPNGWKQLEYILFMHPTPEQQLERWSIMNKQLKRLTKNKPSEERTASISDFQQDDLSAVNEYEEFLYILGLTVYDIFSDNHEVFGQDGLVYDLGSARERASFLAIFFYHHVPESSEDYCYLDFYMGTGMVYRRGDLTPFYEYVFRRLKAYNCDWKYYFPRLYLVDLKQGSANTDQNNLENYQPEQAVLLELEQTRSDEQVQNLREELEASFNQEYEEAKYQPLVPLVQGYKNVCGHLPEGHPQKGLE